MDTNTNIFGGTGEWFAYRNKFTCSIPARMRNAIEAELNSAVIGQKSILPIPDGIDPKDFIPCYLIVCWIEMGVLQKIPNVGKGTIAATLDVIRKHLTT